MCRGQTFQKPVQLAQSGLIAVGNTRWGELSLKGRQSEECVVRGGQTPRLRERVQVVHHSPPWHIPLPDTDKVFDRCLSLLINEWVKKEDVFSSENTMKSRTQIWREQDFLGGNISSIGARNVCCGKWNVWIGWVKLKIAICNMKSLAYLRGNIQLWSWGQPCKFCPLRSSLWTTRWWGRVWTWVDFLIDQTLEMSKREVQKIPQLQWAE